MYSSTNIYSKRLVYGKTYNGDQSKEDKTKRVGCAKFIKFKEPDNSEREQEYYNRSKAKVKYMYDGTVYKSNDWQLFEVKQKNEDYDSCHKKGDEIFKCGECKKIFKSQNYLIRHKKLCKIHFVI